ncbi:erythromycin esterase family protein [Paucibacter sp. APW11]|uniref:Erythromycin esterase family protein n=1 Tax=Roseateles aquae TaxID=3077235 RepID=A0ABU3PHQ1_9BURK|nr:erythromycin esterase family protein [Paucibacter sp. APW11]MDT9001955.1 erythromycin esterase family protein [Paucibacter sp. APW11]
MAAGSGSRRTARLTACLLSLCLLQLTGCGGGAGPDRAAPPPTTPPQQSDGQLVDLTQSRLLSDAELRTLPFPSTLIAPAPGELEWLRSSQHPLRSLVYDRDFSDLEFMGSLLSGKRIVQLGESSHLTREFNQAKVRLIKYLHEKQGFNVIAFESSIIGCWLQDEALRQGQAGDSCVFGVWRTKEVAELFRYIQSTQSSEHPLRLAGFDVQYSSVKNDEPEPVLAWLAPVLNAADPQQFAGIEAPVRKAITLAKAGLDCAQQSPGQACSAFDDEYPKNAAELDALASRWQPYIDQSPEAVRRARLMAGLTIRNLRDRLDFIRTFISEPNLDTVRDGFMASNIKRLATDIYPQEKLIVWAHNAHVSRARLLAVNPGSGRHMGNFLAEDWGQQLYTVGLYMLRGETYDLARKVITVPSTFPFESMERYLASLRLAAVFLPLDAAGHGGLNSAWQRRAINAYVWGSSASQEVLTDNYDALLVIDRTSLPEALN